MLSVVYPPRILMEYLLQPQNHAEYYIDKQTFLSESLADLLCKSEKLSQFSEKPDGKEQLLKAGTFLGVRRYLWEKEHCLLSPSMIRENYVVASTHPILSSPLKS